jgi:hypothetical protein
MNKTANAVNDRLKFIFPETADKVEGPKNIPMSQNR